MGFSINPVDFLKMMDERHKLSRQQVIEWLERVREDGRLFSDTWLKIAEQLSAEEKAGVRPEVVRLQSVVSSRLRRFHELTSVAIEGRLETNYWNGFINRLGGVIAARGKARGMTDQFLSAGKMLTGGEKLVMIDTVNGAIDALQKELADLEVFIHAIKAAPKAIR